MSTPKNFQFPASITDPEIIMDCLSEDRQNALNDYTLGRNLGPGLALGFIPIYFLRVFVIASQFATIFSYTFIDFTIT